MSMIPPATCLRCGRRPGAESWRTCCLECSFSGQHTTACDARNPDASPAHGTGSPLPERPREAPAPAPGPPDGGKGGLHAVTDFLRGFEFRVRGLKCKNGCGRLATPHDQTCCVHCGLYDIEDPEKRIARFHTWSCVERTRLYEQITELQASATAQVKARRYVQSALRIVKNSVLTRDRRDIRSDLEYLMERLDPGHWYKDEP